jgi:hypothetical protein
MCSVNSALLDLRRDEAMGLAIFILGWGQEGSTDDSERI